MKTFVVCAMLMLLGLPTLARAQEVTYTEDQKWYLAATQLVTSLQSSIDDVKTQSLKNAIIYATLYRDKVDLSKAVGALQAVYEDSDRAAHRKLALAALQAIGNSRAANYLARHVTRKESEEGRLVMASVLNDFYLTRTGETQPGVVSANTSTLR